MTKRGEYTEREVLEMRRALARRWGQSLSQVMDHEARWYLDEQRRAVGEDDKR